MNDARSSSPYEAAIVTSELTKCYGDFRAVDHLALTVPRGSVFAFLGRNGAGKTTTIRMLLNLLERTAGTATLLGLDAVRQADRIRQRIGVIAEGQTFYDWMTVAETIWFCKGFYRQWDDAYARALQHRLELDGSKKVRHLSAGQQAKLKLLLALAHRPDLLILDEPTAGMDVLVRRDYLDSIIRMIQEDGRTVFFSTHLIHEVERIADWVGIIDQGQLIRCVPLDQLKQQVRRLVLAFAEPPRITPASIPHALSLDILGRQVTVIIEGDVEEALSAVEQLHPLSREVQGMSLEDIFAALVRERGRS